VRAGRHPACAAPVRVHHPELERGADRAAEEEDAAVARDARARGGLGAAEDANIGAVERDRGDLRDGGRGRRRRGADDGGEDGKQGESAGHEPIEAHGRSVARTIRLVPEEDRQVKYLL
jgi:hypothetical protein